MTAVLESRAKVEIVLRMGCLLRPWVVHNGRRSLGMRRDTGKAVR